VSEGELSEDVFDLEADVVVVGGGAAGFAAAVTASREGAQTLLIERGEEIGGTTARSGGGAWLPNNYLMRKLGKEDPKEPALKYMARQAYPHLYQAAHPTLGLPEPAYRLIEAFYDNAGPSLDYLTEAGAVEMFCDIELPDYFAEMPENEAPYGRKLSPVGRVPNTLGGPLMVAKMQEAGEKTGLRVLTNHRAASLLRNGDGEVVGLEVHTGRRTVLVRARRAVIFASGGFLHDTDLAREYLKGPVFGGCATTTSTGDFVRIGIEAGAQLGNMGEGWWYQIALEHVVQSGQTAGGLFMPFGDSMIEVNRFGRRVVNEKAPYNERGPVHFTWDGREYCNLVLFYLYDDAVARNPDPIGFRYPVPQPDEDVRYVISGDTWEELAANIDERLAEYATHIGGLVLDPDFVPNLKETIERFNGFARTGVDKDFGRGESAISKVWGGATQPDAKNTMHPMSEAGPYHCILVVAGALDTCGGPKINPKAQVLSTRNEPIPGLYGAGNCIASPAAQAYWGPGATIGPALTFGYIAGLNAAKESEKLL